MSQFRLPMTATVLVYPSGVAEDWVAHALEFDLCAVEESQRGSLEKLQKVLKSHVEFGLKKGWGGAILSRAPDKFWNMLRDASPGPELEPVFIDTPKQTARLSKPDHRRAPTPSRREEQYWVMLTARTSRRDASAVR